MITRIHKSSLGICAAFLSPLLIALLAVADPGVAETSAYRSPINLLGDASGATLYVAEHTANAVAVVDRQSGAVTRRVALPQPPVGLALSADGETLYVTGAAPDGALFSVDAATAQIENWVHTGHTPSAVAVNAAGDRIFVANRFDVDVAVIDVASMAVLQRIPVLREPIGLALAADGALLYVANHLPAGASDGDYTAAAISVIDTASLEVVGTIALPNGSTGLRGICASPDGAFVYATHILARYHLPTTQLERGWMNTNALSILDAPGKRLVNTVLLDDVDQGAANPWAPACTPDGRLLCVSHAGTHEVSVIDREALHARLEELDERARDSVPNNLAFLVGLRTRVKLPGNGPRGLWLDNDTAHAAMYYSDALVGVQLESAGRREIAELALGESAALSQERQGEIFFNDAALCFQQWQSCASCHPDARVDGLNWDLLNDGIGNPKNTRSMLLTHQTPPVMSLGVRSTAEMAVRAGIKFIQFAVRPEEDAEAIDAFLKALEPVPSPMLEDGELSAAAQRGKEVFARAECIQCHDAPLYTDLKLHELGFTKGMDAGKPVDTPTLVEVWRTAPYLHDGRAATMREALTVHNPEDRHGKTSGLTEQEIDDLVAYVLSL